MPVKMEHVDNFKFLSGQVEFCKIVMVHLPLMNPILKPSAGYEIKWGENWKHLHTETHDWSKHKYMYK